MELSSLHAIKPSALLKIVALLSISMSMAACTASPSKPAEITQSEVQAEDSVVPEQVSVEPEIKTYAPLNAELVYYVLTAEIAGQRGDIGAAADLYNKAAEAVDSPALAGRATQVANFTRNEQRINRALDRWIEVDPNDADVYIMQAPFLMFKDDYAAVVESVNKALELAPERSQQYLGQISANLLEIAKPEQALDVVQKLDAYQAKNPDALIMFARVASAAQQFPQALEAIESVVEQGPVRDDALIINADILQKLQRGDDGLALLKSHAEKADASLELRFAYAKLLGENGKVEQAQKVFEAITLEQPENQEALFALGLLALEKQDGNLAKSYFSQLVTMGDPGKQAAYFMGLAEEMNGNVEAASIWFASVPAESPRFQSAQTQYITLLADNGQLDKARMHLKLLRKENPDRANQFYSFEATFLRDRGDMQAAYELYNEALIAHPDDTELLYGRAMTAESLDKLDVLEQDLNKILAADPNNASALNALGYTLADKTDRYTEALALIKKALEIKPNDPFYLDSLGWVYYRMGKLEAAVMYLSQAVSIQADPEFMAHLGEVLWKQNKTEEAKKVWQKALEASPDNALLKETMDRLLN